MGELKVGDYLSWGMTLYQITQVKEKTLEVYPEIGGILQNRSTVYRRIIRRRDLNIIGAPGHYLSICEDSEGFRRRIQEDSEYKKLQAEHKRKAWDEKISQVREANPIPKAYPRGIFRDLFAVDARDSLGRPHLLFFTTRSTRGLDEGSGEYIDGVELNNLTIYSPRDLQDQYSFGMCSPVFGSTLKEAIFQAIGHYIWD
jgi:hypothetical protein